MLNTLKTLTSSDVIVGGEYIALCSERDHHLSVRRIKVLNEHDSEGMFKALETYGEPGDELSYETERFMESLGVPHRPRVYQDNHHRLFAYDEVSYRFLLDFTKAQKKVEWLTYLGVQDPEARIAEGQAELEMLDRLDNDDEFDMLASIERHLAFIDDKKI